MMCSGHIVHGLSQIMEGLTPYMNINKVKSKNDATCMRGFRAHGRNLSKWKLVDAYQDNPKIVYSHAVLGLVAYSDRMYVSMESFMVNCFTRWFMINWFQGLFTSNWINILHSLLEVEFSHAHVH